MYSLTLGSSRALGGTLPTPWLNDAPWGQPVAKNGVFKRSLGARKAQPEASVSGEGRLERAFVAMIEAVRRRFTLAELSESIQTGGITQAFLTLDLDNNLDAAARGAGLESRENSLQDAFQSAYRDGAQAELNALSKVPVQKAEGRIGVDMTFDFLEPEAMAFLQSYAFRLIREVTRETRLAVQEVLVRAFQEGGHPYEQAREIKNFIGLTRAQARAVSNFRSMLESGNTGAMRLALERELRDKRFDPTILRTIQERNRLPQEQIDRMVERYRQRSIQYRARMIARTETIRANEAGRHAVWRQARQQGLLDDRTRKKWLVSADERLCPVCKSIARMNKAGVPLGQAFQGPDGPVDSPPAHPHCRCTTALVFV